MKAHGGQSQRNSSYGRIFNLEVEYHRIEEFGKLAIVPVVLAPTTTESPPRYRVYGTDSGGLRVSEHVGGPSVPRLTVHNPGAEPVLLVEGQEVRGGLQNRIVTVSLIVPPGSQVDIPVACVEQGRWNYRGVVREMQAGEMLFPKARRAASERVTWNLRQRRGCDVDQHELWGLVGEKLQATRSYSNTGAMESAYESERHTLDDYVRAFSRQPRQVGIVAGVDGRILGVDVFDHPTTLQHLYPRLIRSYALDALTWHTEAAAGAAPAWHRGRATVAPEQPVTESLSGPEDARQFIETCLAGDISVHSAIGVGEQLRISSRRAVGGALRAWDSLIHLALFRDSGSTHRSWQSPDRW